VTVNFNRDATAAAAAAVAAAVEATPKSIH